MKVAFVALNYFPSVGGAQEHVRRVAEGLARRGHEVEVLTTDSLRPPASPTPGRVARPDEVLGGVAVSRYPSAQWAHAGLRAGRRALVGLRVRLGRPPRAGRPDSPWAMGPLSPGLARAVRRAHRDHDVVVGCSAPFLTLVAPPFLAGGGRAVTVAMPLTHLRAEGRHRSVEHALRRCAAVTASTEDERDAHLAAGVPAAAILLLPPGTDPEAFPDRTAAEARRRLGLPERPTVGYVGRLVAHKGIDTLLQAASRLWEDHPDTTVLVAGSASGWPGFADARHRLEGVAAGRLVVREDFADGDRSLLYSACDVIAFPSREESFGMVTIEAWAARRPVVAADVPAVRCVVRPGIDGLLVPPGDAPALAAALGSLLGEPEVAARLGAAGRARAEGELSWDGIVDGWERFLADAVVRGGRAGTGS